MLLTTYYLPFTTDKQLLTAYHLLLTTYHLLLYSLLHTLPALEQPVAHVQARPGHAHAIEPDAESAPRIPVEPRRVSRTLAAALAARTGA